MKAYIKIIGLVLILLVCGFSILQTVRLKKVKAENVRANGNVSTLNSVFESYQVQVNDSLKLNAARIHSLTYTVDEYERFSAGDAKLITDLKLKLKNVQSVSNVGVVTNTLIPTKIQYVDSVKCLNYEDKFTSLSGCFKGDSINLKIENRDSLTTFVSRIPKHRFLWWTWGVKAIEMNITAQNPKTTFSYLKYIELK